MKKFIFLDIDGVLNSVRSSVAYHELGMRNGYRLASDKGNDPQFDPMAVAILRKLVNETDSKIVISSVWRVYNTHEDFVEIFKWYGWDVNEIIVGATPVISGNRGMAIAAWLKENSNPLDTRFVILDDSKDMLSEQEPNFVWVNNQYGLSFNHFKRARKILGKIAVT